MYIQAFDPETVGAVGGLRIVVVEAGTKFMRCISLSVVMGAVVGVAQGPGIVTEVTGTVNGGPIDVV